MNDTLDAPLEARPVATVSTATIAAAAAAVLAACGGGGGSGDEGNSGSGSGGGSGTGGAPAPTVAEASRFLAQASMGADRAQIARVQAIGYAAWIDEQMATVPSQTRWDALVAAGYADIAYKNNQAGFDSVAWKKLLSSPDTLRQRVTLALSEIVVTSIDGLAGIGWRQFAAAAWLDLLEAGIFGSHRALMQQVSLSPAMGTYLTYRGSRKANPATGALPDENYARELMQLFTIGLVQLAADGTPTATPTYMQSDVTGLARVFTGWEFDYAGLAGSAATATPDFVRRPMLNIASRYETGAKAFLGTTVAAGSDATAALTTALDTICSHPNVAPFLSRQLIQRLVTSNPSAAYVGRVAAVFGADATGARGNLGAVVKAILLDAEARAAPAAATSGKLREPILRLAGWARAYAVSSPSGAWLGNTSDPATQLGQSPLRSPSVFNFFRPGYVPPNTSIASASLVAPEFQITNESSVVGTVNYLQRAVGGTLAGLMADYSGLTAIADDATALVAEVVAVLAAGQVGASTAATIASAVQTMAAGTDAARLLRAKAAVLLVLASPETIVLK